MQLTCDLSDNFKKNVLDLIIFIESRFITEVLLDEVKLKINKYIPVDTTSSFIFLKKSLINIHFFHLFQLKT